MIGINIIIIGVLFKRALKIKTKNVTNKNLIWVFWDLSPDIQTAISSRAPVISNPWPIINKHISAIKDGFANPLNITSSETGTPETAPKIGLFWKRIIKILIIANDVISIGILSIENKISIHKQKHY